MELALTALRVHRSSAHVCCSVSRLFDNLCCDEARAIKAKQLGAPALLQAALKAHPSVENVQERASAAVARIQHFVDAACARAEANMAELIAGKAAAKGGKGTAAAPQRTKKGKGKSGEGAAADPPLSSLSEPSPPVAAGDVPVFTKAQIKRRKAKAAAARKTAAASSSAACEEEEKEESDASSDDSEPFRPRRPPLDFSADGEFRRSMNLPRRPGIEAEINKMVAESEARRAAQLASAAATPQVTRDALGETEGAYTPVGAAAAAACFPLPSPSPLTSPAPSNSSPPAAEPVGVAPLPSSSQPFVSRATPLDVACSSPLCAAEITALRIEAAASREAAAGLTAEMAALRARVAALEAENALLRG